MEGIFQMSIFGIIWFVGGGWISIPIFIISWVLVYLCQDLTFGYKHTAPTYTVCLFNKDWISQLRSGKVLCQNIEHGFNHKFKLGIYTIVHLTMDFISMIMNFFIDNHVMILEICIWLCGQSESEENPHLRPTPFIDKGPTTNQHQGPTYNQ